VIQPILTQKPLSAKNPFDHSLGKFFACFLTIFGDHLSAVLGAEFPILSMFCALLFEQ
jgi:hypothetical protein